MSCNYTTKTERKVNLSAESAPLEHVECVWLVKATIQAKPWSGGNTKQWKDEFPPKKVSFQSFITARDHLYI